MLNSIKKLLNKRYFTEEFQAFPDNYIDLLKDEILNSDYMATNHLNYRFSKTLGFSIIFKDTTKDKVIEKFPYLKGYIDRVFSDSYNAYYLNPLLIPLNSKVDRHIDKSLRSYYLEVSTPERVSVLYVDIPQMQGGNLILYNEDKFIAKIKPEVNKLLYFRGDLKHEVTTITELFSEDIKYRTSLVCEQYSLNKKAMELIPDFLIRSDTSFDNFLKNELS